MVVSPFSVLSQHMMKTVKVGKFNFMIILNNVLQKGSKLDRVYVSEEHAECARRISLCFNHCKGYMTHIHLVSTTAVTRRMFIWFS